MRNEVEAANGTFTSLGAFGPSWVTYGLAINDSGTVVGYHSDPNTNQGDHAFSYTNGTYTDLGALPGGSRASANAINNAGAIVGYSTVGGGDNHAFIYSGSVMADLGLLPGFSNSVANGINSGGIVVGFASTSTGLGGSSNNRAFVYSGGVLADLNSDLSHAIATTLINAVAINDSGQIVAIGDNGDSYLLTPVASPEPSNSGLSLIAICLAMLWRRERRIP